MLCHRENGTRSHVGVARVCWPVVPPAGTFHWRIPFPSASLPVSPTCSQPLRVPVWPTEWAPDLNKPASSPAARRRDTALCVPAALLALATENAWFLTPLILSALVKHQTANISEQCHGGEAGSRACGPVYHNFYFDVMILANNSMWFNTGQHPSCIRRNMSLNPIGSLDPTLLSSRVS